MDVMYTDDSAREFAAAMRDNAAAHRESAAATLALAEAIKTAAAQIRPAADLSYAELLNLAEKKRLAEPPVLDPNTHPGRVERKYREMLAMQHGAGV